MRIVLFFRVSIVAGFIAAMVVPLAWASSWRSMLYPENWRPGYRDAEDRFLQDFSYAGYHRGEDPLPGFRFNPGLVVDVTEPPFLADSSGSSDSTQAIQEAIDFVGEQGGGVVLLPAGIYRVRPQTPEDKAALFIDQSGVILRGVGPNYTFIFNTDTSMRSKNAIRIAPKEIRDIDFSWLRKVSEPSYPLTKDVEEMETDLYVKGGDFAVGDWVVVRADATDAFIDEHYMSGIWTSKGIGGVTFYRQVVGTDKSRGRVELDIPIRYPLRLRDNARITRTIPHIEEVAAENLSIGMKSITYGGMGDDDWNVPGTGAYEVHDSSLIEVNHVVNGWIRKIRSYLPSENHRHHFLSNGLRIRYARSITVEDVDLRLSQYRGAGGNGYHFTLQGSDNLLTFCYSRDSRHNFSFGLIVATGNVIHKSTAINGRLPVDFHMHLSPANLIDSMVLEDDSISAVRRDHGDHGHGTTQSVLWNIRGDTDTWEVGVGIKKLIETGQFGWGYVIGTSGRDNDVEAPLDFFAYPKDVIEGRGKGSDLLPQSLYESQLERRLTIVHRPIGRVLPDGRPKKFEDDPISPAH